MQVQFSLSDRKNTWLEFDVVPEIDTHRPWREATLHMKWVSNSMILLNWLPMQLPWALCLLKMSSISCFNSLFARCIMTCNSHRKFKHPRVQFRRNDRFTSFDIEFAPYYLCAEKSDASHFLQHRHSRPSFVPKGIFWGWINVPFFRKKGPVRSAARTNYGVQGKQWAFFSPKVFQVFQGPQPRCIGNRVNVPSFFPHLFLAPALFKMPFFLLAWITHRHYR